MSHMKHVIGRRVTIALGIAGAIGLQGMLFATSDAYAASGGVVAQAAPNHNPSHDRIKVAAFGMQPLGSGLSLTVGLTPGGDGSTCGTDTSVVVNVGDTIDFCYTVTNHSSTAMAYSTLDDSIDGNLFALMPTTIAAGGGTYEFHRSITATTSSTHLATWTAQDILPGYTFDDTQPAAFVDITATGTGLNLSDDGTIGITSPFPFTFYGVSSTNLCVGNNGVLVFGTSSCSVTYTNTPLPGSFGGAAIAPFWDDLFQPSGNVYWQVLGAAPNRTLVVEWDRAHYNIGSESSDRVQVEVILGENGSLSFQYQDLLFGTPNTWDNAVSATIGLHNADGSIVNQYSFDTVLPHPAPSSIAWTAGTATILTASASVSLDVGAPLIGVSPTSISASADSGSTTPQTVPLTIANTGDRDLDWNISEAQGERPAPMDTRRSNERIPVLTGAEAEAVYAERKLAALQGQPVQVALRNGPMPARGSSNVLPAGSSCGPSVEGIIIHDDNSAENGYSGNSSTVSSFIGVDRFTPTSYPATFTSVCVAFVTNAGQTSINYEVVVFDDTGPGGSPGAELGAVAAVGSVATDIGTPQFNSVDISGLGLNIASGSVYIGVRYSAIAMPGRYVASDENGSVSGNGYASFDTGSGPSFTPIGDSFPGYRALMVRAVQGVSGCVFPEDVPWLSVSPSSGTVEVGDPAAVATVSMNPSGLGDGLYTATVCVNSNDPASRVVPVPVTFTVGDVDPAATVAPTSLDFSIEPDDGDATTLTITNSGDVGSNLTYTITESAGACGTPSDVPWLSESPTNGSVPTSAPASVTVAVDGTGLAFGTYSANLCIATNDPGQPVITVPVTLNVTPPDLIFADGFEGEPECIPEQLLSDTSFEASLDGSGPWASTSSNFGTALCDEFNCGLGGGTAGPRTGSVWAWLGGSSGMEVSTATQTVVIPQGASRFLNFYLWIGSLQGNASNMDVMVDSNIVQSFPEPASPESGYSLRSVDLSAYADGASHAVGFRYSGIASNYSIDDVTLDCQAAAPRARN